MKIGIFESVFSGETVADKFGALSDAGFSAVQFDLASAGLPTLPDNVPASTIALVREASLTAGIEVSALAGTFNMIDPDMRTRQANLERLIGLIGHASALGTKVVTICTGTRDMTSMWKFHPDNQSDQAWDDLIATLTPAVRAAEASGVILGVEPEPANVIRNAVQAKRLLDQIGSPSLGIIADPANLVAGDRGRSAAEVLDLAFGLIGDCIVLAHAKDLDADGEFCPAGTGIVPWEHFGTLLRHSEYEGYVICHSLELKDIDRAKDALRIAGISG